MMGGIENFRKENLDVMKERRAFETHFGLEKEKWVTFIFFFRCQSDT